MFKISIQLKIVQIKMQLLTFLNVLLQENLISTQGGMPEYLTFYLEIRNINIDLTRSLTNALLFRQVKY